FNPTTKINFSLPKEEFVSLKVYDMLGREVSNLVNEKLNAGEYSYDFDGSSLQSGTFFYRLQSENFSDTKKMILLK
ncbi:MAG TPA: T9SS C-terminal target domain-containing protein, partial [Bacteroidetes bacterium]|nr:T9SS C-terminal target domain-containing protein [Bacteroidota bacterium]